MVTGQRFLINFCAGQGVVFRLSLQAVNSWRNDVERWLVLSPSSLDCDQRLSADSDSGKGGQVTSWCQRPEAFKTPQLWSTWCMGVEVPTGNDTSGHTDVLNGSHPSHLEACSTAAKPFLCPLQGVCICPPWREEHL